MVVHWETSRLDGKCASQVGYVYDKPVSFQVWLVNVAGLSAAKVLVLNQDGRFFKTRQ